MERSGYCCGESIRLKAEIDNQSEEIVRLRLKLVQVGGINMQKNLFPIYVVKNGIGDFFFSGYSELIDFKHLNFSM